MESQSSVPPYTSVNVGPGTTFRARWRDELSNTVTWRLPFEAVSAQRIASRRAWKVYVNPLTIDWTGRFVELQRRSGGKWVRYKRSVSGGSQA